MTSDKIILRAIRFYGYHGVSEEEQITGRLYEAHVELFCDLLHAGRSDQIRHTVNYRQVFDIVVRWGTQKRFRLIEALAHHIAEDILRHTAAEGVRIRISKLNPPLPGVLEAAAVEIVRTREALASGDSLQSRSLTEESSP